MSKANKASTHRIFLQKVGRYPLIAKFLVPSLTTRLQSEHWYENRVLRYVLTDSPWIDRLESEFAEAQLPNINGSDEIFGDLSGTEADYDEQLFDAIAEVRLARWARAVGYYDIEKLHAAGKGRTPDFLMHGKRGIALAEAKHFRSRDFPADFICDRLEGLALVTGGLSDFGLLVDMGVGYGKKVTDLRQAGPSGQKAFQESVRKNFGEGDLETLEYMLRDDPASEIPILDGITAKRQPAVGKVSLLTGGSLGIHETVNLMLSKLCGEFITKLSQIQNFLETNSPGGVTSASVFFGGVDGWGMEWSVLWEELGSNHDPAKWPWDRVQAMKDAASRIVDLPFELIVGKDKPGEYSLFLWNP